MIPITINGEKMLVDLDTTQHFDAHDGWTTVKIVGAAYTQNGHELVLTGALSQEITEEMRKRGQI